MATQTRCELQPAGFQESVIPLQGTQQHWPEDFHVPAARQVIKLPAGKYTVREREMLTGSGLVPADFFTAGSSLSKAVIGCGSTFANLLCISACCTIAQGCCPTCSVGGCCVLHVLALPVCYLEGLMCKGLRSLRCYLSAPAVLLGLCGLLTACT